MNQWKKQKKKRLRKKKKKPKKRPRTKKRKTRAVAADDSGFKLQILATIIGFLF